MEKKYEKRVMKMKRPYNETTKSVKEYRFHDGNVYLEDEGWLKAFHEHTKRELKDTRPFSEIRED